MRLATTGTRKCIDSRIAPDWPSLREELTEAEAQRSDWSSVVADTLSSQLTPV